MTHPWLWLFGWCADDDRRNAELSVDPDTNRAVVELTFRTPDSSFSTSVTGEGEHFEFAVLAAREKLPEGCGK